jgi:hypothetical protein
MTQEQLEAVLKQLSAKLDKEGWWSVSEGIHLTIHVAHDGASLSVPRVGGVRVEGALVTARTPRGEMHCFARDDVFAVASDGGGAEKGRRPGFG